MNNSQFEETEESGIDLRHYYILLRKHRFLIITCLVLYVAVNLYFTLRMMPIYQSSTFAFTDATTARAKPSGKTS